MKHLKGRKEFLNESNEEKEFESGDVIDGIKYNVDYSMEKTFKDYSESTEEYVTDLTSFIGMKEGEVWCESGYFGMRGKLEDGTTIEVNQGGEYTMYGGPYDPKMERPDAWFNDIDCYFIIKNEAKQQGWIDGDNNEFDMMRTDLYPMKEIKHFISLPKEDQEKIRKGVATLKKYNL